jgi:hypothetical protein
LTDDGFEKLVATLRIKNFYKILNKEFPKKYGDPPGFNSIDVTGDGNCFYYAIGESRSKKIDATRVARMKLRLLEYYNKLGNEDKAMMPGVSTRLRTDFAWAQEAEIFLTASMLNLCIFVFVQRWMQPHIWTLHVYASPKMQARLEQDGESGCLYSGAAVYDKTKYSTPPHGAIAIQSLFLCPRCLNGRQIFLLNVVDGPVNGNHYKCLKQITGELPHGHDSLKKDRSRSRSPHSVRRPF